MNHSPASIKRKAIAWASPRLLLVALMLTLPFVLPGIPSIQHLDRQLIEFRFANAPRAASGKFAFVAIDKQSLDYVGTWPWPRNVHADVIDRLIAAGARDIFLDIDFSTPSVPDADQRLARSLEAAGGGVILPVFQQHAGAGTKEDAVVTRPIPELADNAWLADANVKLDDDGLARGIETVENLDGEPTQTVAAVLAGWTDMTPRRFAIDYSILPEAVPVISVSRLLAGKVQPSEIEGRSIVVGAYATELKDFFSVPVHGVVSGPMLHILAAETLSQNRLLEPVDQLPIAIGLALLIIAYVLRFRSLPLIIPIAAAATIIVVFEGAAFWLQRDYALILQTATFSAMMVPGLIMLLAEKIGLSSWLAEVANAEKRNTRRILQRVISDSADAVIIVDSRLQIIDASRAAGQMFSTRNLIGRKIGLGDFAPAVLVEALGEVARNFLDDPDRVQSEPLDFEIDRNGEARNLEAVITLSPLEEYDGHGASREESFVICVTIRDMTARRLYEDKLQHLLQYDELTGLLNRRELAGRITQADEPFAVFAIDLHRFAILNGKLGREMGDALLKAVGKRLSDNVGEGALVGRLGGDGFCVAIPRADSAADLATWAERLIALVDEPFQLQAMTIETSARIGACLGSSEIGEGAQWVEAAELALDDAKKVGGSGWKSYDPEAALRQARSRLLEGELRKGLVDGQFFLLYQPQVDLKTGKLIGAEALIRWKHPTFGIVSPGEFISIAEANGFICDLGNWTLLEACREARHWPDDMTVAVNVAPVQFAKTDVVAEVKRALEATGLPPQRLQLEITESTFLDNSDDLIDCLRQLRALGVTIALDDFGTGYSSLSYIAGFPLDKLKIDQSFIRNLATQPTNQAIIKAVKSLAHGLGVKVVCEGVEREAEWVLLNLMGCEIGQGYYFGRPQSAEELLGLCDQPTWAVAVAG